MTRALFITCFLLACILCISPVAAEKGFTINGKLLRWDGTRYGGWDGIYPYYSYVDIYVAKDFGAGEDKDFLSDKNNAILIDHLFITDGSFTFDTENKVFWEGFAGSVPVYPGYDYLVVVPRCLHATSGVYGPTVHEFIADEIRVDGSVVGGWKNKMLLTKSARFDLKNLDSNHKNYNLEFLVRAPLNCRILLSPTEGLAPLTVTLKDDEYYTATRSATIQWGDPDPSVSLQDVTLTQMGYGGGEKPLTVAHTYSEPGEYTVNAVVKDGKENCIWTKTVKARSVTIDKDKMPAPETDTSSLGLHDNILEGREASAAGITIKPEFKLRTDSDPSGGKTRVYDVGLYLTGLRGNYKDISITLRKNSGIFATSTYEQNGWKYTRSDIFSSNVPELTKLEDTVYTVSCDEVPFYANSMSASYAKFDMTGCNQNVFRAMARPKGGTDQYLFSPDSFAVNDDLRLGAFQIRLDPSRISGTTPSLKDKFIGYQPVTADDIAITRADGGREDSKAIASRSAQYFTQVSLEPFIGDCNTDGYLNNLDIDRVKYLFQYGVYEPICDLNSDNKITQDDVDLITQIVYGTSPTPVQTTAPGQTRNTAGSGTQSPSFIADWLWSVVQPVAAPLTAFISGNNVPAGGDRTDDIGPNGLRSADTAQNVAGYDIGPNGLRSADTAQNVAGYDIGPNGLRSADTAQNVAGYDIGPNGLRSADTAQNVAGYDIGPNGLYVPDNARSNRTYDIGPNGLYEPNENGAVLVREIETVVPAFVPANPDIQQTGSAPNAEIVQPQGGYVLAPSLTANCTAPLVSCNGACVDVTTDVNNCGACGNVCAEGYRCSDSLCMKVFDRSRGVL